MFGCEIDADIVEAEAHLTARHSTDPVRAGKPAKL